MLTSVLGGVETENDRVLMFGADATIPQAAAALAPQDQKIDLNENQGGDSDSSSKSEAMSPERQLRFYLGSSQWAPNQLQQELLRGSWTMIQVNPSVAVDVFETLSKNGSDGKPNEADSSELQAETWQNVLAMISPAHAALAAVHESVWQELQVLEI